MTQYYIQVKIIGIANENGIEALNDIVIPRGSTYSKTITLYNPSKDKKIRIHRVGSYDDTVFEYIINAPSQLGNLYYF